MGDPVAISPSANSPTISTIVPDSGSVGDTVTINGTNFGSTQGSSNVNFGAVTASQIISWSTTQIKVQVPTNSVTGNVSVAVGSSASNSKSFKVINTVSFISFLSNIKPMFTTYGCTNSFCHGGGAGGLNLPEYTTLMIGGNHGVVVVPNNAEGSNIIKKLRANPVPFGSKMPANGLTMSDADLQKLIDWINQGALNN